MSNLSLLQLQDFEPGVLPADVLGLSQPALLRGFINHWPVVQAARESDTFFEAYLTKFDTDQPLTVYTGEKGAGGKIGYRDDYSGFTFNRETGTLASVLAGLKNAGEQTLYIGSTRVDCWLPGFRHENDVAFGAARPIANFWLGNQTVIAAHNDTPDNLACCVAGKRTFTLFPPEQIENLYIGPVDLTPSGRPISLVDFSCPDYERFPRFREAEKRALIVDLMPGDALYIPSLWWHHVRSHSPLNMLVNYWWKNSPDYMGIPDLALDHAILALRGLPAHQRDAWKALFDYYIFSEPEKATDHIPQAIKGMLDGDNEKAARLGWLNFSKKLNS